MSGRDDISAESGSLCGGDLLAFLLLQIGLLDVFSDLVNSVVVGLVAVLGSGSGTSVGQGRSCGAGGGLLSILLPGLLSLDLLNLLLGLFDIL